MRRKWTEGGRESTRRGRGQFRRYGTQRDGAWACSQSITAIKQSPHPPEECGPSSVMGRSCALPRLSSQSGQKGLPFGGWRVWPDAPGESGGLEFRLDQDFSS